MPGIQFSAGTYSTPSNALRIQNFLMTYTAGGPTSETGYWTQYPRPSNGWVIYINKATKGPTIYSCETNEQLIATTSQISQTTITTLSAAIAYFQTQTDKVLVGYPIPNIVLDGLILYYDAAIVQSYPTTGNTWSDLSGYGFNATKNVGDFNSAGYFTSVESPGYASLLEFTTSITGVLASSMATLSGGWCIEEWILVNDTTYPEAAAGTVVSNSAYGAGAIGFDWNHGQTNMSQIQMGASWNVDQPQGYDVRGFITLNTEFRNYGTWYLRHLFWNRDTAKMGAYYNGVLQGDIDISILNGYPICDGGTITWGQLYGWRHDGARASMRIYNKILSSSEILQNFNSTKGRFGY